MTIKADGPSIEYLSVRDDSSGQARWNLSTRWVEVDRACGMTFIATKLIEDLWSIAKARYLGLFPSEGINPWREPAYGEFTNPLEEGEGARFILDTRHSELDYYAEPEVLAPD